MGRGRAASGAGLPGPGDLDAGKPPRRDAKYRRTPDEDAEGPRDVLLRAEPGKNAVWRDEETAGMRSGPRKGPRRGADARAERMGESEERQRVRAAPVRDPEGRRVTVERVTGASPEIKRKPRYTRDDFRPAPDGDRPFRKPRFERDAGGERPPRKPRFDREDGGERRGPPRERGFGDRSPGRSGGGFKPRGEGGFKARGEGGFKPRGEGGFKPRSGGDRPRGGGDFKPRGPRKPRG